jgi:hypothetical protein
VFGDVACQLGEFWLGHQAKVAELDQQLQRAR